MRFRAVTDQAGQVSIVILFIEEHEPIHLDPAEAVELAETVRVAGEQAMAERAAAARRAA